MKSGIGDAVDNLFRKIDQNANLQQIRRDTASLLLNCLEARGEKLDAWQKMHFEMAIALLPTVWLRLALTHIRMALEPPDEHPQLDDDKVRQFAALSAGQLIARLAPFRS